MSRRPILARVATGLVSAFLCLSACGRSSHELRRRREAEENAAYWQRHAVDRVSRGAERATAGEAPVREPHVPHVLCMDGTPSIRSCSPQSVTADCCVNQGGVYRDQWGNAVGQ